MYTSTCLVVNLANLLTLAEEDSVTFVAAAGAGAEAGVDTECKIEYFFFLLITLYFYYFDLFCFKGILCGSTNV